MRRLVVVPLVLIAFGISACGDDDDDSSDDVPAEESVVADADVPDVIGDSVEEATAALELAGFTLRVVRRDGEDLAVTMDFIEDRVNVAVETEDDGTEIVTEVVSTG